MNNNIDNSQDIKDDFYYRHFYTEYFNCSTAYK